MPRRVPIVLLFLFLIFFFSRSIAGWVIEYHWWKEIGQLETWLRLWTYDPLPYVIAAIVAFLVLFTVHARALKSVKTGLGQHQEYAQFTTLLLLAVSGFIARATIQPKIVQMFAAGQGALPGKWHDPAFGMSLNFYLFDYPFYIAVLNFLLMLAFVAAVVFAVSKTIWAFPQSFDRSEESSVISFSPALWEAWSHSMFLRVVAAIFFCGLAMKAYLGRFALLYEDHGFMVGVDYVAENVQLPLILLSIATYLVIAVGCALGRYKVAAILFLVWPLEALLPRFVNSLYVKPNEISLQKPYVARHLESTRAAYGLSEKHKTITYKAKAEANIDLTKNKALLSTVRIWDWRAFHDTVTQIQPLRPYAFQDTDVDRYNLQGSMRQVLLSARELDLEQLGDARNSWPNTHFTYTHGYGVVAADANRLTSDGLPLLFIQDAPPKVSIPDLKLTRPEIYFGETAREPVFVNTEVPEFNYPSGSENVHSKYEGKGGFPIDNWWLRLTAAVYYSDSNILLTGYLKDGSRMMIHRRVRERVSDLASFLEWDQDPYLVIDADGKLVWLIDGFTTADTHPYSQRINSEELGRINYIRNSVKATVDAYTGETRMYVFDTSDPIIAGYQHLFPSLFLPASAMPASLRSHTRYPETMFATQARIFQTFHMTDPDSFYNKADVWDFARETRTAAGKAQYIAPSYQIATLPEESEPEFLLTTMFTPRGKDNLLGIMAGRCDKESLGELVFVDLPKQELFYGPMQVEARLNQDQQISKDLTLWNQQGSQVVNGQMQVLPIDGTFLYIQPLYLQASQAKMPQLKKVVMAIGNRMVYANSYEEGLAEIAGTRAPVTQTMSGQTSATAVQTPSMPISGDKLETTRRHMKRYRELLLQGKYGEAGKELEAMEAALR